MQNFEDFFFLAFSEMDENNDGQITQDEFIEVQGFFLSLYPSPTCKTVIFLILLVQQRFKVCLKIMSI